MVRKQNKVNEIIIQEVILLNPIHFSYIQTNFFFFFKLSFQRLDQFQIFDALRALILNFMI